MTKAVYAFSGDPITFGHIDIIKRVIPVFDSLVVAIGNNPAKKYIFSLEERLALARKSLENYESIEVVSFQGMLSDFCYEQGATHIIRGLRNAEDFNYEMMLHQVNQSQDLGIETFFIPCTQDKTHISSGATNAIQLEQGLVHKYVPLNVKQALEDKISNQRIIGVTGSIASGKSTYCQKVVNQLLKLNTEAHHIDLDKIAHEILTDRQEPLYRNLRQGIIEKFGNSVKGANDSIDRVSLGQIVFSKKDKLDELNRLLLDPILTLLRKRIYGLKGLILIESALLIEAEISFICNNQIVFLEVDQETQNKRLIDRGYSEKEISNRLKCQFLSKAKIEAIKNQISIDGFGQLMTPSDFENTL